MIASKVMVLCTFELSVRPLGFVKLDGRRVVMHILPGHGSCKWWSFFACSPCQKEGTVIERAHLFAVEGHKREALNFARPVMKAISRHSEIPQSGIRSRILSVHALIHKCAAVVSGVNQYWG